MRTFAAASMDPLNPQLYRALERCFGHVGVCNPGDPGTVSYRRNRRTPDRLDIDVCGGERYRISCPYCSDTRQRLYISYLWGVRDPRTGTDRLFLVNCFNEGCVNCRLRQESLFDLVYPFGASRTPVIAPTNTVQPDTTWTKAALPQNLVPVTDRRRAADAVYDLEERDFNIRDLWERWRVCYTDRSEAPSPRLFARIVIPVYRPSPDNASVPILAGWQARATEPVGPNEPKYLSCSGMPKTRLLYGLTSAISSTGPLVIVEGPTDVWRLKSNAVALFGKTLSREQEDLLLRHFSRRPLVIFLDRDAASKARAIRHQLRMARKEAEQPAPVLIARLPRGRDDVAECPWKEAWLCVARALDTSFKSLRISKSPPAPRHTDCLSVEALRRRYSKQERTQQ